MRLPEEVERVPLPTRSVLYVPRQAVDLPFFFCIFFR